MSSGPVAQFRPMTSMPRGSSAVTAALISEPSNIVLMPCSMVTEAMMGTVTPSACIAS
jgi:hypothetical protein